MRYHGRYLQGNESTRFPSSVIVFDTETLPCPVHGSPDKKLHRLRLWCAKHWRFEKGHKTRIDTAIGATAAGFWEFLYSHTSRFHPVYCFAHNVGFDLTTLRFWREIDARKVQLAIPAGWRGDDGEERQGQERTGVLCLNDPPTIVECWKHGTRERIVFLDTMNYWRCSLAELGEELGIVKNPMPEFSAPETDWEVYCWQDVAILEAAIETLERFIREHDCGVFKYTIGSQAMASFKHAHMRHKIVLHREEYPLALEREAYRGGEVRLGYCGRICEPGGVAALATADEALDNLPYRSGPVYVLDCQAFYPSVMQGNDYPRELLGSVVEPSLETLSSMLRQYYCIGEVGLNSPLQTFPVKHNGQSLNAVGQFKTALCQPELEMALTLNAITFVGRVNYYRRAKIFDSFVSYWFGVRARLEADGKHEQAMMVKSLMNSLFGKFGQRKERWQDRKGKHAIRPWGTYWDWDIETGDYEFHRSIGGRVQVNQYGGESGESFPAIAAAVTSYGRARMGHLREIAGFGNWYYQDTDSLHCNAAGLAALQAAGEIQSGKVGKLKLIGAYRTAEYRGIKDYSLDDIRVIAGIKRTAVEVSRDVFTQLEFQRLASVLSAVPNDGVFVTERTVAVAHSLPPGRVLSDGTVLPPILPSE